MASISEWPLLARGVRRARAGALHALVKDGPGHLPPLVFLHGVSARAAELGSLFVPLARHSSRVVAIDLPGHGHSPAPAGGMTRDAFFGELVRALDHVVTPDMPAIVFGNSLGGLAAIRYANARPDRVRGLFLSSPGGAAMAERELRAFLATFRFDTHAPARAFVERLFAKKSWLDPIIAAVVRRRFAHPPVRALLDGVSAADLLAPEEIRSLRCPTLIAWGTHDRIQGPDQLAFFRLHASPTTTIEEPERWTHCPHLDAASAVRARLLSFAADCVKLATPDAQRDVRERLEPRAGEALLG